MLKIIRPFDRGLAVLEHLDRQGAATLADLAQATGLPEATLHRRDQLPVLRHPIRKVRIAAALIGTQSKEFMQPPGRSRIVEGEPAKLGRGACPMATRLAPLRSMRNRGAGSSGKSLGLREPL